MPLLSLLPGMQYRALLRMLVLLVAFFMPLTSQSQSNYIPPQAYDFKEYIQTQLDELFPSIPYYEYVPALIEHESCQTLKHKRCWNSRAKLSTSREKGIGLGMITVAYHKDGSIRFDKLTELRTRYKSHLQELSWSTIETRPDLQIKMIVLMLREDYGKLYDVSDRYQRLSMVDNAYNGGYGGLQKERRLCSLTAGCNPNEWFGNVELMCLKSKKALYGNRSVCEISRHHTRDVMLTRLPKYQRAQYFYR